MSILWHISKRVARTSFPCRRAHRRTRYNRRTTHTDPTKSPSETENKLQAHSHRVQVATRKWPRFPRLRHHFHGAEKSSPRTPTRPAGVIPHITGSKSRLAPPATAIPRRYTPRSQRKPPTNWDSRAPLVHTAQSPATRLAGPGPPCPHPPRAPDVGNGGVARRALRDLYAPSAARCSPLCSPLCFPADFYSWLLSRAEAVGLREVLRESRAEVRSEREAGGWDEDPVRRVRGRGGHGGVLRGRGGAVRALRRRDPRRQQAGQQAPAAPSRRRRRRGGPPALRRLPGEAGLHLLRRGQGALLPRLRRAHPRPGDALGEPPALPRHRHPRRLQLRLRRRRRSRSGRPPAAQGQLQLQARGHRGGGQDTTGRQGRAAAGGAVVTVPAAVRMGRRGPPAALRLRIQRQGLASWVQGAGVVRGHRPVPRPRAGQDHDGGGPRALRLAAASYQRGVLQGDRCASEQEAAGAAARRRGRLLHRS